MILIFKITNEEILDFEIINYFNEQGYNIFNKNDKFYKDVCSPANINDNDMTLNDRYIDIYPHDIKTCPKDCECLGINVTTEVFICECEIKKNNEYEYELTNKDEILNYFKDFNILVSLGFVTLFFLLLTFNNSYFVSCDNNNCFFFTFALIFA